MTLVALASPGRGITFADAAIVFLVGLVIGGAGIYVGARFVASVDDYRYAFVTGLIGAVVWAIVGFFFGWIPFLGPALTLFAYVAVINYRYPGGWLNAVAIALVAWVAALAILYVLALFDVTAFDAVGVPGA